MNTLQRVKILKQFGSIKRVEVHDSESLPFRYALMIDVSKSKQDWFARSGDNVEESVRSLYDLFSNTLWERCLEIELLSTI